MKKQFVKLFAAIALVTALSSPAITGQIGTAIAHGADVEEGSTSETLITEGTGYIFGAFGAFSGGSVLGPVGGFIVGRVAYEVGTL